MTDDRLMTVGETADYLRTSSSKIYELVAQEQLPHIRLGRKILVPRWALVNWVSETAGVPPPPSSPKPFLQH